jgi:hypothetical protein
MFDAKKLLDTILESGVAQSVGERLGMRSTMAVWINGKARSAIPCVTSGRVVVCSAI